MNNTSVYVKTEGNIATLVLNRPAKRNALNREMLKKITEVMKTLSAEDTARCVVIRGKKGTVFSSGYDISEIPVDIPNGVPVEPDENNWLLHALNAVEDYPYPVIALIEGFAGGAGLELACSCDIRIAAGNARMGVPASKLGVVYHPEGIRRFIRAVGTAKTVEMLSTGRFYSMDWMKEAGMVSWVVSQDEIHDFTCNLAEEISCNAPLSLRGHKYIVRKLEKSCNLEDREIHEIQELIRRAFQSRDAKEGALAFFEKRKPEFAGK